MRSAPTRRRVLRLGAAAGLVALASGRLRAEASTRGFITSQNAETLTVLDLDAMTVLASLPISGKPAGIALAPGGRLGYVTAPDSHELVVVDTSKPAILRRLVVGRGPLGVAALGNGRVAVADWYDQQLYIVDAAGTAILGSVTVGRSPSGIAVSPDGGTILTADRDSDQVSIIDAATLKRLAVVPVGTRPFGVTVDADGAFAFTANVGSDDVTVIDIAAREVIGKAKVGRRPYACALAQRRLFVTDQYAGTVSVIGLGSLLLIKAIDVGDHPEGIGADAAGRFVYVACWGDNVVKKIDAASLAVVGSVAVPDGPRAFGLFIG
jgi:YVTN family beta-propeller protein